MNKIILTSVLSFLFPWFNANSQTKIMSFNIRYDNPKDGEDQWAERRTELCQLIQYYQPTFIGLQESMPSQIDFIDKTLKKYAFIGIGRDGEGSNSEAVPIFYDTTTHTLLESDVFWLSETPAEISKGWDAALNRIVTYGAFKNKKTSDTIHLFNAHFDHKGEMSRINAAQLLLKKIEEHQLTEKQVIVMGDLNCQPHEEPILILKDKLEDAFDKSLLPPYGPIGTFNAFKVDTIPETRIDYIFSQNLKVLKYRNVNDKRLNSRCISDHLPVLVEIEKYGS